VTSYRLTQFVVFAFMVPRVSVNQPLKFVLLAQQFRRMVESRRFHLFLTSYTVVHRGEQVYAPASLLRQRKV